MGHLAQEAVPPDLLRDACHDYFVPDGRDEEGDECGHGTPDVWAGGAVDVSPEEVVDGNVPFAGEFQPIGAIPPVRIKVSVCEAWGKVSL